MSRRAATPHPMADVRFLRVDVTELSTGAVFPVMNDGAIRFDETGDRLCCVADSNQDILAMLSLHKSYFLSIIRHECASPSIGLRFLISDRYDQSGHQFQLRALGCTDKTLIVDVVLPAWSGPAVFAFLQSLAIKWPDARIDCCSCCAAPHIPTYDRPEENSIDREIWPSARITLVEWNLKKGKDAISGVLAEIVVMKNFIVFHLDPPHMPLALLKSDILFKTTPIISPFVGVKLHLASTQFAHAIIEIADKDDLCAFMNVLLFHWNEQTMSGLAAPDFDMSHLSLDESMDGNAADVAESTNARIIAKSFPALYKVERPLQLLQNSFLLLDRSEAAFSAVNQVEKFTVTNLGAARVVFAGRYAPGEQNHGQHNFNFVKGFIEPGASFEISLTQIVHPTVTVNYQIGFARVAAHLTEPEKAYKHTAPCGHLQLTCRPA